MQNLSTLQYLSLLVLGASSILAILSRKSHVSTLSLAIEVISFLAYLFFIEGDIFQISAISILMIAMIFFLAQVYYLSILTEVYVFSSLRTFLVLLALILLILHKKIAEVFFSITNHQNIQLIYKTDLSSAVIIFFAVVCAMFCALSLYSSKDQE